MLVHSPGVVPVPSPFSSASSSESLGMDRERWEGEQKRTEGRKEKGEAMLEQRAEGFGGQTDLLLNPVSITYEVTYLADD